MFDDLRFLDHLAAREFDSHILDSIAELEEMQTKRFAMVEDTMKDYQTVMDDTKGDF